MVWKQRKELEQVLNNNRFWEHNYCWWSIVQFCNTNNSSFKLVQSIILTYLKNAIQLNDSRVDHNFKNYFFYFFSLFPFPFSKRTIFHSKSLFSEITHTSYIHTWNGKSKNEVRYMCGYICIVQVMQRYVKPLPNETNQLNGIAWWILKLLYLSIPYIYVYVYLWFPKCGMWCC